MIRIFKRLIRKRVKRRLKISNQITVCCKRNEKEAGIKVLASQLSLDCRAWRSGWVGSTTLIPSAFTALLNCAEVGRRNRILTNYRFLSHSLFTIINYKDVLQHNSVCCWDVVQGIFFVAAEHVFVINLKGFLHFKMCIRDRLSRAVKTDEISVVEPTQPLRLARQSKDNWEARTFVPASFSYSAIKVSRPTFIISVKVFWRSSAVVSSSGLTKLSEIVIIAKASTWCWAAR